MIISRTPFRISFTGGSTDLKSFYELSKGAVVSTAIDKYIYITVNKRFDSTVRASYSKTEIVDSAEQIHHPIIREALKLTGITNGIEITSIADIPSGTGLGSSSSFTVGLLNALYAYKGKFISAEKLADTACKIEIDILKEPIGKQDQYAASFGGINFIQFNPDGSVHVDPVIMPKENHCKLSENLLLFYTGIQRSASAVLESMERKKESNHQHKMILRDHSYELINSLHNGKNVSCIADFLNKGWEFKKLLSPEISNSLINQHYQTGLDNGAAGGKLLGAGGGGFLLFYVPHKFHKSVRNALKDLKEVTFNFDYQGSKIVYVE